MEVHFHFKKEKVLYKMQHIITEDQAADLFSKGLNITKLAKFREMLNMVERHAMYKVGIEDEY